MNTEAARQSNDHAGFASLVQRVMAHPWYGPEQGGVA